MALLVEGMVAQRQEVRDLEQSVGALRGDPTPRWGGVLRVDDDGVEGELPPQLRDEVKGGGEARGADHVPDEEQAEGQRISPIARGR